MSVRALDGRTVEGLRTEFVGECLQPAGNRRPQHVREREARRRLLAGEGGDRDYPSTVASLQMRERCVHELVCDLDSDDIASDLALPGVRSPITINGVRMAAERAPPTLGEHTDEVLREIGEA